MSRWHRYWFAEGGRTAAACLRIAIAASVLLTLKRLATLTTVHIPGAGELYRPVGIWMIFGHHAPPDFVVTALWVLAFAATSTMLLGLASRASTVVSFVSAVALTSASFSASVTWSHQYNVVFLAQLAFLGARGGDALSLDAWLRLRRGLPMIDGRGSPSAGSAAEWQRGVVDIPRGYQWSVRLVQLAVALMFTGAAFHKLLYSHFTLHWALSDNLRHQLLVRYDLAGLPRPPVADWVMDNVWRYRTAAVLNLISQASPILACIFIRRPWVRALAGGFFVIEVIALGLVVNLWNLHWLPLGAAFVDWERLRAWIARTPEALPPVPSTWAPPRNQRWFVLAFVIYDAITAVIPKVDQWLNTYPFSAFPMFATVRARAPYDVHQTYGVPGDRFEVRSDRPLDAHAQQWIDHMNRRLYQISDPVAYEKRLRVIYRDIQRRFGDFGIHGVRHYLAIFEAPAYPAPARFDAHPVALMGVLDEDGTFHTVLGTMDETSVTLRPKNVDARDAKLVAYRDDRPAPSDVPATRAGDRFDTGAIAGAPLYVAAIIAGEPWLVASRKAPLWE